MYTRLSSVANDSGVSKKMAQFGPESVAHFAPEWVAYFGSEWVAQFGPEYADIGLLKKNKREDSQKFNHHSTKTNYANAHTKL